MSNSNRIDTAHAWAECPTKRIHELWSKTQAKNKAMFDNDGSLRAATREFVDRLLAERCCLNMHRLPNKTLCDCTACLDDTLTDSHRNELAVYIIYFHTACGKKDRQALFIQWIKYGKLQQSTKLRAQEKHRVYILPGATGTHVICRNTLARVLGFGRWQIDTVLKCVEKNEAPSHGLDNKKSNATNPTVINLMEIFFDEMQQFSAPRATKIVRNVVGTAIQSELRDEIDKVQELPVYFTKRSLFKRLLAEAGYDIKLDSKCRVLSVTATPGKKQTVERKEDLPTWQAFLRYWKQHHPFLVTAKAREDVCGECYVFANSRQFTTQKKKVKATEPDTDDEEEEDENASTEDDGNNNNMEEREKVIEQAALHVEMAKKQREYFNLKKQQSKDDHHKAWVENSDKVWTFVADYAQNMYIPNFSQEQPGETYYYSPMNAYVFGVACTSYTPTKLVAHVYLEDQSGKGSNNVTSLLYRELDGRGCINREETTPPAKEINFVFDNCGGQNKNKTVLRFMNWLVARGSALVARAIFLVRGHTKNDCDRLFNLMKQQYRKRNTYTPQQLLQNMKHPDVTVARVKHDEANPTFRAWTAWQNQFMTDKIDGTRKYHIFTCDKSRDPNALYCSTHYGADETKIMIVKEEFHGTDWATATFPNPLPAIKVQDIKYKELYDKWRPLVPEEHHKEWEYFAVDPGPEFRKKVNEASKKRKLARTKASRGSAVDSDLPTKKPAAKKARKAKK